MTSEVVEGGARLAVMTSRVLGGIGIALSGISLIFDVIQLVEVSKDISQGSKCEVAQRMEEIAEVMENETKDIIEYMDVILREDSDSANPDEEDKIKTVLDDEDYKILFNSEVPDIVQNALDRTNSINHSDNQQNEIETAMNKKYYMLTVTSIDSESNENKHES